MELDLYRILDKADFSHLGKYKIVNGQRVYNCPFHTEKTGSFYVNGTFYKCFGCGKGGNAINFLADFYKIPTKEAYKIACELLGIKLEKVNKETERINPYEQLSLPEKLIYSAKELEEPNEYLLSRGITEIKVKNIYELKQDFRDSKSDLLIFKGCLIIPIYNNKGKLVNAQYITKNGTKRFLPGCEIKSNYLELIVNKDKKEVFLTEGLIDALTINLAGFNAVFCLSCENIKAVALYNNETFYKRGYVFSDNDEVGIQAGDYASTILGTKCLYIHKAEKDGKILKDANDYLRVNGLESLKQKIEYFLSDNILYLFWYLIKQKLLRIYHLSDTGFYKVLFYKKEYVSEAKERISDFILNGMIKNRLIKSFSLDNSKGLKILKHEIVKSAIFINNETYAPDYKYFDIVYKNNKEYINVYHPSGLHSNTKLKEKPFKRIRKLLLGLTNNDKKGVEWFLDFLAFKWQKPWIKHKIIIVFHGKEGTGKSPLGCIIKELFGDNANVSLTNQSLESQFNTVIKDKLIVCVEEVSEEVTTRLNTVAKLKAMSGSKTITINEKGKKEIPDYPDLSNIIMFSNEEYIANVGDNDTRYVIFKSYLRNSKEFFEELFNPKNFEEEVEGLAYHLANRNIQDTLGLYHTEAKESLQELSKHPIYQAIEEIAFNPNQVIAEVSNIKKLPLVYKKLETIGVTPLDKYINLEEDTSNNLYYYEEYDDYIIMSTNQFIEIIKCKTNLPCRNAPAVYTEARKSGLFEYDFQSSIIKNRYGMFRICKIYKTQ